MRAVFAFAIGILLLALTAADYDYNDTMKHQKRKNPDHDYQDARPYHGYDKDDDDDDDDDGYHSKRMHNKLKGKKDIPFRYRNGYPYWHLHRLHGHGDTLHDQVHGNHHDKRGHSQSNGDGNKKQKPSRNKVGKV